MDKYRSSSRFYISDSIMGGLMLIGIGYLGVSTTDNIAAEISVVMVTFFVSLWIVRHTREVVIDVIFQEQFIIVYHIFKESRARIHFEDIVELQYIHASKSPTINKMKFNYEGKLNSIRFRTVAYGAEFIDFVKWIKSKNDKIKVSVFPPDDYMNHRLQEEYGFNYRKVPKLPTEE